MRGRARSVTDPVHFEEDDGDLLARGMRQRLAIPLMTQTSATRFSSRAGRRRARGIQERCVRRISSFQHAGTRFRLLTDKGAADDPAVALFSADALHWIAPTSLATLANPGPAAAASPEEEGRDRASERNRRLHFESSVAAMPAPEAKSRSRRSPANPRPGTRTFWGG
jgi:hypothetical protein